jgi:hypothetical protein
MLWGVDWIHLAHDRDRWLVIVNKVMNLRVPKKAGNFLTSWATISFSRRTTLCGVCWLVIRLSYGEGFVLSDLKRLKSNVANFIFSFAARLELSPPVIHRILKHHSDCNRTPKWGISLLQDLHRSGKEVALSFINHHAVKMYAVTDGVRHIHAPATLPPVSVACFHLHGGLVGSTAAENEVKKGRIPATDGN